MERGTGGVVASVSEGGMGTGMGCVTDIGICCVMGLAMGIGFGTGIGCVMDIGISTGTDIGMGTGKDVAIGCGQMVCWKCAREVATGAALVA